MYSDRSVDWDKIGSLCDELTSVHWTISVEDDNLTVVAHDCIAVACERPGEMIFYTLVAGDRLTILRAVTIGHFNRVLQHL
jgi:hypothetical protein